ncbi:GLUG motif-containing protein [Pseudomonas sp. BAY1663]
MASDGGAVALLGGTVSNQGVIVANSGTVALAAGNAVTLDFAGDGLLNVQVDEATKDALVENRQLIQADGGQVLLTAQAADALLRTVVNNDGIIEARTLGEKNGKVVLNGGDEGSVQVAGTLDTSATTGQGGAIEVTGANVALADATLDASGATGGGSVKVGGDWQGTGTLTRAQATTVDAASTLKADATHNGDGGTVVVWSDQHTSYQGHISAKGGAQGGDGGQAEVSGKAVLGFTGTVDLSAAHGAFGDLLLDPYDLTISSGTGGSATATADDSTLGADTLEGLLADANVTVSTGTAGSQNGDITVASAVSWDANTTLTLNAAGNIDIDAAITASGESAGLALNYGGTEGVAGATAASGTDYNVNAPVTLSGADATLSINGSDYTLIHSMEQLDAIDSTGLSGHYALAQDLDASDSPYTSALVGIDAANAFTGTFAGLGHAIGNLTISASGSDYVGLFGYTGSGSTLRDVGLQGGSVTGNSYVGGLVGYNDGGSIVDAYATVDVTGAHVTGGLVGANVGGGSILRAYATGWVNATASEGLGWAGGLIGQNAGSISQSYASGGVTGDYYVGGLVGHNGNGTVTDSYALGNVHGQWDVGG